MIDRNRDGIPDFFTSIYGHQIDDREYDRMELGVSVPFDYELDNVTMYRQKSMMST